MRKTWLGVTALVVTSWVATTAQEKVRLQFELRRGEGVMARPALSLSPGSEGSLEIDGRGIVKVTATLLEADRVSLAFDIEAGTRHLKPRLVLKGGSTGSLSIAPDAGSGDSVGIAVTWQR